MLSKKTQETQGNTRAGGNVKPQLRKRAWMITINNPDENTKTQLKTIGWGLRGCGQFEVGEIKETPHLHMYIYFKEAKKGCEIKKIFPVGTLEWVKNKNACIEYCTKQFTKSGFLTRTNGPYVWGGLTIPKPTRPLKLITELRSWQQEVLRVMKEEPDERTVHWFWDERGLSGKTVLSKLLCANHGAIFVGGKAADAKYAISEQLKKGKDIDIVIFGFTRSKEDYVTYDGIEAIKDGMFFSNKYESGMCLYNCPHVICFANFEPEQDRLSTDRWVIRKLD